MKNLIILLLLISSVAFSQTARQELQRNNTQSKARMQAGNQYNDKFAEKYNYQNNNQTIVCESFRGKRNHCNIDTRYGVNLIRQISSSSCNYNWGYDQSGIWVDAGCRAEFSVNFGWDQPGAEGNIMVCESHNYQRNYCPAFLGGRDVFLLRQVSNSSCQNNWGFDRSGVWVNNGCRAEFVVEDRHGTQNDIVVCSSRNRQFQSCQANTRGGVDFLRQLSRASCNGNWGHDRQGIWVTNGCRARFRLINHNNNNYGNNTKDTIKCSSRKLKRRICSADTSGGVRLKKQHSRSTCEGNWGFSKNQIWVANGCRATFQLFVNGYRNNNGYDNNGYNSNRNNYNNNGHSNRPGNNNNYGNQQNQVANIICSSRKLKRTTCTIPRGSKVEFKKQLSKSSCLKSWGYNQREIWVDNGCRAQFHVF